MGGSDWAPAVTMMVIGICVAAYYITKVKHTDIVRDIEKLGELKAKGLLTEEEFTKQKRKILGN